MILYHKVRAVERVFRQLEKEVATFQQATNLSCLSGCGKCCRKPDIFATPLEFLPLAYHLFKANEAQAWYDKLKEETDGLCPAFAPFLKPGAGGFCNAYGNRGLICRIFGFSAVLDKLGNPRLATCRTIKEEKPLEVTRATEHIRSGGAVPLTRDYYFQLLAIDEKLAGRHLPIREAIREALEAVLAYYAYRRPRKTI
ncbi:YkgJ family cysteine cluster protein [Robiginitalea sp. SC105]|uniref:YkgJ family cysteine cluster protein n=1 Tax=Robiginitalea sp. SC105 TaxID=2762332 RepID=UPI00163B1DAB|nr:YkgJ family cysteine cluster protein [Robiginitalea sp. SC105]MBC2839446.1 YkgJ family cysteine cluster protein [Robiginitalea sp. SC105]